MNTRPIVSPQPLSILRSACLFLCVIGLATLSAQEPKPAEPPSLAAGRYILITKGDAERDPVIVNITKTKDGYSIVPEDPSYAESTITVDSGSYIFQLTQTAGGPPPEQPQNSWKKSVFSFVGVPSDTTPRAISGSVSRLSYYYFPSSPHAVLGNFLLFPIDKAK